MNLFEFEFDPVKNWLPKGGTVNYYGKIFNQNEADYFLKSLLADIEWRNDEAIIFGKKIITKRKVAWYGEKEFEYTYSKITKLALNWTKELLVLKAKIEQRTGESFNSCLLNLYHDGNEGMAWHSDDEKKLKKKGAIASLSFGVERKFIFKHKESKEKITFILENGSLLVMKDETQSNWQHKLPTTKLILKPRVNLTFRTVINNN
ncbi:MAG: alpha-ketoglutarate-dependent dioxygenase AlkB [Flavobacteriales bacterium]|mgnify:CR=1 FL=1|tara:strand:+ start:2512 stop:3126 length:615 start_codon:yes stop_codon:yes gene_type:complete